jgi:hypothetical protein
LPESELGEEIRSEDGGYAFRAIPDYTVDEFFGMASMEGPDADPDIGPAIYMIGGIFQESTSLEQLHDDFTTDLEEDILVTDSQEILVDGVPGQRIDVSGSVDGTDVAGRVVLVAVTPNQQFTMIGTAPPELWGDGFSELFDAVLASVSFFDPVGEPEPTEETEMGGTVGQWASTATASSEYGEINWGATQATGEPDVPECDTFAFAWTPETPDTVEWLELGYDFPVLPTEVNIIQNYNPDQVVAVELLDTVGEYHTIYTGEPEDMSDACPYTLSIPVEGADYQALGVKITIDQSVLQEWLEIDAVELVGVPEHPVIEQ